MPNNLKIENKEIKLLTSTDFNKYGRVINGYNFEKLNRYMESVSEIPQEGNLYLPSVADMETDAVVEEIKSVVYGGMEIQVGYCNGNNSSLNGLEYHKGNEINYATTSLVLLLGTIQDIQNNQYDSDKVEAFFIPKGTAIEIYQTTLHFAPCKVMDEGFKCIVILPKGTNTPIEHRIENSDIENKLLFMKNKWLLVHPNNQNLVNKGAYPGIIGENLVVKYA